MYKSVLEIKLEAAIREIVEAAQLPLNKTVIETWLSDYKELCEELKRELAPIPGTLEELHDRSMCEFDNIYDYLTVLSNYYRTEQTCETAMNEYNSILLANSKGHDNLRLAQWVRKYEQVGRRDLSPAPLEENEANVVKTIYDVHYVVPGEDFSKSMEFHRVFTHLFWEEKLLPDRIAEIRKERALENERLRNK